VPGLILFLVVVGAALLWLARRRTLADGLPLGRLIYLDAERLHRLDDALYDSELDLAGRPDFVVMRKADRVPVEVKSGRAPVQPHESHVIQLAAYCHLVQVRYGTRPSHGVLKYADRAFAIDYTPALESRLRAVVEDVRQAKERQPGRSHGSAARCRSCGYRGQCDQRLA
jgi:CRISPR-associated exonuclease Cas4